MLPTAHPLAVLFGDSFKAQSGKCVSCNRCKTFCAAFPRLYRIFEEADQSPLRPPFEKGREGGIPEKQPPHPGPSPLSGRSEIDRDLREALGLCSLCGQCELRCPASLDLAKHIMKAKIRYAESGLTRKERLVTLVDSVGRWGSRLAPVSNLMVNNPLVRRIAASLTGIDPRRRLPRFARQTFHDWAETRRGPTSGSSSAPKGKVVYFAGCTANYFDPAIGRAAVAVLERQGMEVVVPAHNCCGLPSIGIGDEKTARSLHEANLARLLPYVEEGCKIVCADCNCVHMMRNNAPFLWPTRETNRLAEAVTDLTSFLGGLALQGRFDTALGPVSGDIRYHYACHARTLRIGNETIDLMRSIPGLKIDYLDTFCCGMGGAFGMKAKTYDLSLEIGADLFKNVRHYRPDRIVTDAPLCGRQIHEATGVPTLAPVQLLAEAYGIPTAGQ